MRVLIVSIVEAVMACAAFGSVYPMTVNEVDGITQTGRVIRLGLGFKDGDIANCAVPIVSGVQLNTSQYQCDAKTRYLSGSLKTAVVRFIATLTPNQALAISYTSGICNNSGYLDVAGMLAFNGGNWNAQMLVTAANGQTVTVDAKTMLGALSMADLQIEYEAQGPLETVVHIQDATPTFAYDFGWPWNGSTMSDCGGSPCTTTSQYASLHPVMELAFQPSTLKVEMDAQLYNNWSTRIQDQKLTSIVLKTGSPATQVYTSLTQYPSGVLMLARTNFRKVFWSGATPGHIRTDWNFAYLMSTKLIPNYDTTNGVESTIAAGIASEYTAFAAGDKCDFEGHCELTQDMGSNSEGAPEQHQPLRYLHTMGTNNITSAKAWYVLTGEADTQNGLTEVPGGAGYWNALANIPFHVRESATTAGHFFYCPGQDKNANPTTACGGSVVASGRGISRHAYPAYQWASGILAVAPVGSRTNGGWDWDGWAHWLEYAYLPALLTGSRYYREQLYDEANGALNAYNPDSGIFQNGVFGYYGPGDVSIRTFAWSLQSVSKAALLAPDATIEKTYYTNMVSSNEAMLEGFYGLTGTSVTPSSVNPTCSGYSGATANRWDFGRCTLARGQTISLHNMTLGQCPINGDALDIVDVANATSFDEEYFNHFWDISTGSAIDAGFTVLSPGFVEHSKRLIESIGDPTTNRYLVGIELWGNKNGVTACTNGANADAFLSWAGVKASVLTAYRNPTNFLTYANPSNLGGVFSNFPCADHGYSALARAASTFMTGNSSGAYTGAAAWAWLSANAPYFANVCTGAGWGDSQLKFAILPRSPGGYVFPMPTGLIH